MNINLKKIRKEKGLTLKQLSFKTGISVSFLSDIELDKKYPNIKNAKLIGDVLEVDFKYLLNKNDLNLINTLIPNISTDPNIRSIIRASKLLNDEQCRELRNLAERLYPHTFNPDFI